MVNLAKVPMGGGGVRSCRRNDKVPSLVKKMIHFKSKASPDHQFRLKRFRWVTKTLPAETVFIEIEGLSKVSN